MTIPRMPRMFAAALAGILLITLPALAQKQTGGSFAQLSRQADQARDAEDLDRAAALYRQALAVNPRWTEGWWSLGTIQYDRNSYREAAQAFERVAALSPKNGTAFAMLGLCQFELGSDGAALRNIRAGLELGLQQDDSLRRVVLYHAGVLQLRQSKFSSAQQSLTQLAAAGAQEDRVALSLGMAVLLVHPAKLPPEGSLGYDVVHKAGQAESLAAIKQTEEARKLYHAAIQEAPDFPNLHYAYGRFLLELRETEPAVAEFQQEIRSNPRHVQANLEIAAVRYRVNSAEGLPYAQHAVELDPSLPFGHYLLGLLYLDTGSAGKAIPELEIARKKFPNEAKVYFALGTAYARQGRKAEAAQARATFTRLNNQHKHGDEPATYGQEPSGTDSQKIGADTEHQPE